MRDVQSGHRLPKPSQLASAVARGELPAHLDGSGGLPLSHDDEVALPPAAVVVGFRVAAEKLERYGVLEELAAVLDDPAGNTFVNTELRARLAEGRSVRYQLPEAVERIIRAKGLYGTKKSTPAAER